MRDESVRDEAFEARRQKGREMAGKLQGECEQAGQPLDWFEGLYKDADGNVAGVPWADCAPHRGLSAWLENVDKPLKGKAIDVGCGLGDNASALQDAGFEVTAFDLSQTAIDWAIERNQGSGQGLGVKFQQADLFELPADWIGAFDFVHETYTIQALKGGLRAAAFAEIASLVKPGGQLLAICRSRPDDGETSGPPWPISPNEMQNFENAGLTVETFEEFDVMKDRIIPHFRVLYRAQE